MSASTDPRNAPRPAIQSLMGMLTPERRATFLEALRGVPREATPEDAIYLALRKIGMNERQAHRMIMTARMQVRRAK